MILYRPVGPAELELIRSSAFRRFPPRLPDQPIFYPVLNFNYAEQIARDWNSKTSANDFQGYVTRFSIDDTYGSKFEVQIVGAAHHQELWVPAEELEIFNDHILGEIDLVASYRQGQRT